MLNKVQQVRNALIYIIPLGIRGLLPLITLPIFTRILSPEDYGILSLAMIYAIFLSGLANFGISVAYERNYFQYHDNQEKQSVLVETISGIESVKVLGGGDLVKKRWEEAATEHSASSRISRTLAAIAVNAAQSAQQICLVGIVFYGVFLVGDGKEFNTILIYPNNDNLFTDNNQTNINKII